MSDRVYILCLGEYSDRRVYGVHKSLDAAKLRAANEVGLDPAQMVWKGEDGYWRGEKRGQPEWGNGCDIQAFSVE